MGGVDGGARVGDGAGDDLAHADGARVLGLAIGTPRTGAHGGAVGRVQRVGTEWRAHAGRERARGDAEARGPGRDGAHKG